MCPEPAWRVVWEMWIGIRIWKPELELHAVEWKEVRVCVRERTNLESLLDPLDKGLAIGSETVDGNDGGVGSR